MEEIKQRRLRRSTLSHHKGIESAGDFGRSSNSAQVAYTFVQSGLKMQTAQPLWAICYTACLSTWYHFFSPLYLTQASRVRLRSSLLILWQRAQPYLLSKLLFRNRKVAVLLCAVNKPRCLSLSL